VIDGAELYEVSATCNYAVTGLTSRSGMYKFGMTNLYIPWYGGYVNVGVVMYDPDQPGVYTAARVDINNNCDFTDDPELRYFGNRLIVNNPAAPPSASASPAATSTTGASGSTSTPSSTQAGTSLVTTSAYSTTSTAMAPPVAP
jgi:hypothetical protein